MRLTTSIVIWAEVNSLSRAPHGGGVPIVDFEIYFFTSSIYLLKCLIHDCLSKYPCFPDKSFYHESTMIHFELVILTGIEVNFFLVFHKFRW